MINQNHTARSHRGRLTRKMRRYVAELVVCRNGSEAARRAGYSVKTARQMSSENLTKPAIRAAIAEAEAELAVRVEIDQSTIIAGIISGIAAARQNADAGNVIRGYVSLAKVLGLDKPDAAPVRPAKAVTEDARLRQKLEAMSDQELADIAAGRRGAP